MSRKRQTLREQTQWVALCGLLVWGVVRLFGGGQQ